jgi:hypothetical protein
MGHLIEIRSVVLGTDHEVAPPRLHYVFVSCAVYWMHLHARTYGVPYLRRLSQRASTTRQGFISMLTCYEVRVRDSAIG